MFNNKYIYWIMIYITALKIPVDPYTLIDMITIKGSKLKPCKILVLQ